MFTWCTFKITVHLETANTKQPPGGAVFASLLTFLYLRFHFAPRTVMFWLDRRCRRGGWWWCRRKFFPSFWFCDLTLLRLALTAYVIRAWLPFSAGLRTRSPPLFPLLLSLSAVGVIRIRPVFSPTLAEWVIRMWVAPPPGFLSVGRAISASVSALGLSGSFFSAGSLQASGPRLPSFFKWWWIILLTSVVVFRLSDNLRLHVFIVLSVSKHSANQDVARRVSTLV